MELVAMATDLAEFLGAALGFRLLLGFPLLPAAILTTLDTFLLLGFHGKGSLRVELIIACFLGIIGLAFLLEVVMARPLWHQLLGGLRA
jgi:manganese transport protein